MATTPRTLNELFFGCIDRFGGRPVAMRVKRDGAWRDISYPEFREQVQSLAAGLRELGVEPGSHVAILSENRPEWAIVDFACLTNRAADVPIYPTLPASQIAYILRDSGAMALVVSTRQQLEKVLALRQAEQLPDLKYLIAMDPDATGPGVRSLAEVLELGDGAVGKYPDWREEALQARPDDLATLIYTSGTTGDPKGVMLTHGNLTSNVVDAMQVLGLQETDECLSFLPLSHVFERMAGHYCTWYSGCIINYAQSIDTVSNDIVERRPTVVVSVPRLYEKIYARVLEGAAGSPIKQRIFSWSRAAGEEWAEYRLARKPVPAGVAFKKAIADKLVFSKLRHRTGGRLRFFVSGGAPLSAEIAKFFYAAGLPIYEGYGLTETSPVIAVNSEEHIKLGTVGRPIPGVEVRIAPDGEILTRGPNVMQGYYHKPEATAEAIDADGWFHTGDIGLIDADGFLKITDRKKDIIVTAGGKNIAPQPIENRVKTNRFVLNAVMLGDRRKFPIMLVVPDLDQLRHWAVERSLAFAGDDALIALREAGDKIEREIKKTLRDLAQFEMPKKIVLIERDFTIESGELTPTLKVKRRVVEKNYRAVIEALYQEPKGGEHDT
ncbi:MAG TPA: long-chain fatty acid--CoA ligase [Gemmatimonadales bacterium]|nr:long-chain fatty acid--CoA ligase [Gemmatimonadales bacterium]